MYSAQQLDEAAVALRADPNLPAKIAGDVRRSAALARGMNTWAEIDSELAVVMGRAMAATGATRLLILLDAQKRFDGLHAEKLAADKRESEAHWHRAHEARFGPVRERLRQDWAERVSAPIFAALDLLGARTEAARKELFAARTEDDIEAAIGVLDEAIRSAKNSITLETKALARRKALAAAESESADRSDTAEPTPALAA